MSRAQLVWAYIAAVAATLGFAAAWFTAPLIAAILAIMVSLVAWAAMSLQPVMPPPSRLATVVAVAAVATVAATGLINVGGVLGLAIVGLLVMTAPPTVAAVRTLQQRYLRSPTARPPSRSVERSHPAHPISGDSGGRRPSTTNSAPHPSPSWNPSVISALSDEDLCRAWQASYLALHRQPADDHRGIAAFRAAVLDELQTRHPRRLHPMDQRRCPRREQPRPLHHQLAQPGRKLTTRPRPDGYLITHTATESIPYDEDHWGTTRVGLNGASEPWVMVRFG